MLYNVKLVRCKDKKVMENFKVIAENNLIALLVAEEKIMDMPKFRNKDICDAGMWFSNETKERDLVLRDSRGKKTSYVIELY